MMAWWKHARAAQGCGPHAHAEHCGGHGHWHGHRGGHGHGPWHGQHDDAEAFASGFGGGDDVGGGPFGVRRPLRFLAHKLELEEKQVEELARILSDLKTERAQAAVDYRRTTAGLADLLGGETFDAGKANEIGSDRVKSAERLRDAVTAALGKIHAVLDKEQRDRLGYLLRTGQLVI
jgi:hypothetical protein